MSRNGNKKSPKPKRPKTRIGLPDLDHSKSAVLDSLRSRESKRGYRHTIDEFIQWYCSEPCLSFNKIAVTRFRIFLENRNGVTERVVWHVVKQYAKEMGVTQLAPHDLRRSCAKLCHATVANWSKFNYFLDTCPSRQPNATWDASREFAEP